MEDFAHILGSVFQLEWSQEWAIPEGQREPGGYVFWWRRNMPLLLRCVNRLLELLVLVVRRRMTRSCLRLHLRRRVVLDRMRPRRRLVGANIDGRRLWHLHWHVVGLLVVAHLLLANKRRHLRWARSRELRLLRLTNWSEVLL